MKRLKFITPLLVLIMIFSISCATEELAVTVEEETETAEEAEVQEIEEEPEGELIFSYTNKFPEFWGKIRMVEPSFASFEDIEMEIGEGILEGQEAFSVSGKLKGEQAIRYCFNPDQGIFATITGVVVDNNSNIKWSQDGFLQGTGSYIKENEVREFLLINSVDKKIEAGDNLILIAHTEYGMIEDDETLEGDVDKGVFAEFKKEISDIINIEVPEEAAGEEEPEEEVVEESEEENVDSPGETDSATLGEKNALRTALDYLNYTSFSYSGLVEQLEFEGYTHKEAVYGADNCGADWNEQAALMAEDYLDYSSFSRDGLIDQLEFEGFTRQQAEYGVQAVGY
jgi:hypothetical protein